MGAPLIGRILEWTKLLKARAFMFCSASKPQSASKNDHSGASDDHPGLQKSFQSAALHALSSQNQLYQTRCFDIAVLEDANGPKEKQGAPKRSGTPDRQTGCGGRGSQPSPQIWGARGPKQAPLCSATSSGRASASGPKWPPGGLKSVVLPAPPTPISHPCLHPSPTTSPLVPTRPHPVPTPIALYPSILVILRMCAF